MDHAVPSEGRRRSGEVSGFGWFSWAAKGSPEEAAALAELRERIGAERFDLFQRDRERDRHPRPLTEGERAVIDKATAPVLRDLEASGAIVPEILYLSSGNYGDGREGVSTRIALGGGHGGSVWVPVEQCSPAGQVQQAAYQLQEWEIHELWEHGRPATWPECPEHPGTHPLEPDTDGQGSAAVWRCPRTQQVICAIGVLGS